MDREDWQDEERRQHCYLLMEVVNPKRFGATEVNSVLENSTAAEALALGMEADSVRLTRALPPKHEASFERARLAAVILAGLLAESGSLTELADMRRMAWDEAGELLALADAL